MTTQFLKAAFALSLLLFVACSKDNSLVSVDDGISNHSVSNVPSAPNKSISTEIIPWGVECVGGGIAAPDKTAWIIDSGIDLTHPDLNVDLTRSISFVKGSSSPTDEFGHGTHVAGVIGAIKGNGIGVVGVAAGAKLVSVRVMNKEGNGTIAAMVAGIEYVGANGKPGDVANISFEAGSSLGIDNAVIAASNKGIRFVIAAGNNATIVSNSPARVNGDNIYTVSAMDKNNLFANFSNYGKSAVDYCAPGVEIYSTGLAGTYSSLNGTSMAAPHVAGLLLIGSIHSNGNVLGATDGIAEPIAHH
ncbi:MAG: S8 family serine peptidase [Prolixibacteraceae bacterium]|nr:S8 family serine peptidase [Prolixibacteraceae bacterium]